MLNQCQYVSSGSRQALETIEIVHPNFTATVLVQGAQLIEFRPTAEPDSPPAKNSATNQPSENWLWLSEQASYQTGKSVRGGIPICWPWFGNLEMNPLPVHAHIHSDQAHGFARNMNWQVKNIIELDDQLELVMSLNHDQTTLKIWPFEFELTVHFVFKARDFSLELRTHNLSEKEMTFSQALHSYLPTTDITATHVEGLDQQFYLETLEEHWPEKLHTGRLAFNGETDRIYLPNKEVENGRHYYLLELNTPERKYLLENHNSQSCIIWNPWIEKSKRLSDFADDAYKNMFCVETANCSKDFIHLAPQESHSLALNLTAK